MGSDGRRRSRNRARRLYAAFLRCPTVPDDDIGLTRLRRIYENHPDVVRTEMVYQRPSFRRDDEEVLAVDVNYVDRVPTLARQARQLSEFPIGDLACFNVDFSREFRYCLENDIDPTPASELSTLRLSVPVTETTGDAYTELSVDGETIAGSTEDILTAVQAAVDERDPDILVCSTSQIIPRCTRWPRTLASTTFAESMARCLPAARQSVDVFELRACGSLPARYNVPGRAIIDESNTFFYGETNLDGVLDLVSRSKKPIQELAWASIGNVSHRNPDL